jgi:hypothetical protein
MDVYRTLACGGCDVNPLTTPESQPPPSVIFALRILGFSGKLNNRFSHRHWILVSLQ